MTTFLTKNSSISCKQFQNVLKDKTLALSSLKFRTVLVISKQFKIGHVN